MRPITGCGPAPKCSCSDALDIACGGGGGGCGCGFGGGAGSAECDGFAGIIAVAKGDPVCGSECVVWLLPVPVLGDVGGDSGEVAGDGGAVVPLPLLVAVGNAAVARR